MKVCVRGPLLSMSGYGNHTRQVYRWLSGKQLTSLKTNILSWGITPWYINPDFENGMIGEIMKNSVDANTTTGFDMSFQVQLPNEWDPRIAKLNVGVTAGIETDICNPEWIKACNRMSAVIVPSEHTKQTFLRSGNVEVPIIVIPESYPDSIINENVEPISQLDGVRTNFNFLVFGQLTGNNAFTDRKNTFFTLKWLLEEFSGDSDVGVIIKTNLGKNTTIDRKNVRNVISKVVQEIGSNVPVYMLHGAMNDSEIASLYRHPKVAGLVSATRGEGYGLPLLEAAASGLPVLATNWSGHKDFLDKSGKWISFDYDLKPVVNSKIDGSLFVEGSQWAEVKEDDFKKKVRKFRKSTALPNKWAGSMREKLLETHSFESIAKIYDSHFSGYFG